jgi:hypothetical protein
MDPNILLRLAGWGWWENSRCEAQRTWQGYHYSGNTTSPSGVGGKKRVPLMIQDVKDSMESGRKHKLHVSRDLFIPSKQLGDREVAPALCPKEPDTRLGGESRPWQMVLRFLPF